MVSLFYRIFVGPYRYLRPSYVQRPRASSIIRSYLKYRQYPSWTSYFVEYRQVQDDHFAEKHFNFDVDGHNYHVLRTSEPCYSNPDVKWNVSIRSHTTFGNFFSAIARVITNISFVMFKVEE